MSETKQAAFTWREITWQDQPLFHEVYQREGSRSCEHTFTNNLLWSGFYHTKYTLVEGNLVFLYRTEPLMVSFPIGKCRIPQALEAIFAYFKEKGQKVRFGLVTKEQFQVLDSLYPGRFQIDFMRDAADYVYESEKLIALAGKKLHGKRNHINQFKKAYPDYAYESITPDNVAECIQMAETWRKENGCDEDEGKSAEMCVTLRSLQHMEALGLTGGLLRAKGEIVAFSLGEPLCDDTFVVHIEKAFSHIPGAYPMINQQFVAHAAADYKYINREEDTGAEGLRQAKLSYHPAFLQEKGIVTLR